MNKIINRELDKVRGEIVSALLQKHHLGHVRGSALRQVMGSVFIDFNDVVRRLESIRLEPLRRQLRNEYNLLDRTANEDWQSTSKRSEYVAANLPNLIEAEVIKILGTGTLNEADEENNRKDVFQ